MKLIVTKEEQSPVIYPQLLEGLFENIAKIIEIHQPLVETKYGWCTHTISYLASYSFI